MNFFFGLQEYIHRVGRTARGIEGRGHALLILRPEELGFLRYLKQAKVPLKPPVCLFGSVLILMHFKFTLFYLF